MHRFPTEVEVAVKADAANPNAEEGVPLFRSQFAGRFEGEVGSALRPGEICECDGKIKAHKRSRSPA
jgi:hypothetical protein